MQFKFKTMNFHFTVVYFGPKSVNKIETTLHTYVFILNVFRLFIFVWHIHHAVHKKLVTFCLDMVIRRTDNITKKISWPTYIHIFLKIYKFDGYNVQLTHISGTTGNICINDASL